MGKRTALLRVLKRNAVRNAKSGKARINIIETAGLTTGYSGGAKNARVNTSTSVTSGLGNVREGISDMKSVIGLLMESSRSIAASVKDGKARAIFSKIDHRKTA
jgi:hypothetical protein